MINRGISKSLSAKIEELKATEMLMSREVHQEEQELKGKVHGLKYFMDIDEGFLKPMEESIIAQYEQATLNESNSSLGERMRPRPHRI